MISRLYRGVLRLYPLPFRERFGPEMLETIEALNRGRGSAGQRIRAVWDAIATAVAVHAEYRAERRAAAPGRTTCMENMRRDLSLALRGLHRERAFSLFVIATLALAIGANAALFGIADRLLLRGPDHVASPDRVMRVYFTVHPQGMGPFTSAGVGQVTFDILRRAGTIQSAAVQAPNDATLGRGPEARPATVSFVSAGLFPLTGVSPALGRFFTEDEDSVAATAPVVVISHAVWHREFRGAADAIGRVLIVNDEPHTIIGVAPRGFTDVQLGNVEAWAPMTRLSSRITTDWRTSWNAQWMAIIVRLRDGVTATEVETELTAMFRAAYTGDEPAMATARVWVAPLSATGAGVEATESRVVRWLWGVAALVLLIACVNVMNLLLARGAKRTRDIGVRLALGASRARVVRMLVIESVLLALVAAAVGLGLAWVLGGMARAVLLDGIAWTRSPVDARVLGVSILMALIVGVLVGLFPALRSTRTDLVSTLRRGAREGGGERMRMRAALTMLQAALSVALLIGAGLFVRSLRNAVTVDLGMDADRVLIVEVERSSLSRMPAAAAAAERARRRVFLATVLDRVRLIPGVEHASVAVGLPFGNRFGRLVRVPGLSSLPAVKTGGPSLSAVSGDYFATMGTQVRRGRAFTAADRAGSAPVAIINDFMARTVWPDADPIGACVQIGDGEPPCATIVGIAEQTNRMRLVEDPKMHIYIPLGQEEGFGGAVLLVRSAGDPSVHTEAVRRELVAADPTITFVKAETMAARVDPLRRPWLLGAATFGFSGLLALLVAIVGIYSVVSYLVADRRHEIGVRIALGARTADVAGMVVRWSVGMALAGVAAGSLLAVLAGTFLQPLLFSVSARDPLVFGGVAVTLILTAALASAVPAVRASRVNPIEALRTE